ncbi:hypothetical protein [Microseira wollei]|uniref:Uncharacterized protein n=1 Tax=Microseira wollei NIES-4236 TaxID=2530354 RepID=A0AAV3X6I7_9CYAN|nr:hypothetical protein [Microseira wollei]GET38492.1 hypothetical protein MiSe_32500 [Microseira wollei NIES-4236]
MPRSEPPRNRNLDAWYPDDKRETPQREKGKGLDFMPRLFGGDKPSKNSLDIWEKLAAIWPSKIAPILIEQFGLETTLYAILYAGKDPDEIIMEIWDPQHVESKPSQVFKFKGDNKDFPETRSQAEVMSLTNWD